MTTYYAVCVRFTGLEDEQRNAATVHHRLHRQLHGHRLPEVADRLHSALGAPVCSCAGNQHLTC